MSSSKGYNYILGITAPDGTNLSVNLKKARSMPISYDVQTKDDYWNVRTIKETLPMLSTMSNAYSLRTKAETTANQYVNLLRNNALTIEDAYLTAYIYSLVAKIYPSERLDFFKYNVRVIIAKDEKPDAGIFPNGALVINAGMLARIHSEDELVALLCHEVNHFVSNHYLVNMAKKQSRETIGTISSVLVGAAAGAITGSASIGLGSTSLAHGMASDINALIESTGLAFDQTQEKESDQAAVELLPILGYDVNAMATCIKAIGDYYIEEGNLSAYYKSGKHPKIEDRIAATGVPYLRSETDYEKKIAPCLTYIGQILYSKGRYRQAMEKVSQNISNGVGSGTDYYLKGECLIATDDTDISNNEARNCLIKAREFNQNDIPALKALIITDIRLGNKDEAKNLLEDLITLTVYNEKEQTWAKNMMNNLSL